MNQGLLLKGIAADRAATGGFLSRVILDK